MATKIVTKNSSTASAVPTASDLVQGELAVNVADKRLFTEDNAGAIVELGTNPSTIDINAGTIDGTTIGASSASTGAFTTLTATGAFTSRGIDDNADATAITIDSSENVGIGTSSPSYPFHLSGSGDTVAAVTAGASSIAALNLGNSTNLADGGIRYDNSANALILRASNTERMRIDASGKVGISTSDPKSSLEVKGTFGSPATSGSAAGFISRFSQSSGVGSLDFGFGDPYSWIQSRASNNYATNFDLALQPNGGNVGIGTSSPSYKADILATNQFALRLNTTDADGCFLAIQTNGTAKGYLGTSHHLVAGTPSENDITLRAENNLQFTTGGGSERMRLDSDGATIYNGKELRIKRPNGSGDIRLFNTSTYATIESTVDPIYIKSANGIRFDTNGNDQRMLIDNAGKVGIGTSSPAKLLHLSESADGAKLRITRAGVSEWDFSIGNTSTLTGVGAGALELLPQTANSYFAIGQAGTTTTLLHVKNTGIYVVNGSAASPAYSFVSDSNSGMYSLAADNLGFSVGGVQKIFLSSTQFNMAGNGVFSGSISKGSGSFKIDHPLPEKTDTHHLVHSFVESPQADNIYRGKVNLVDGSATVNIDDAAGMTEGTYVLLNTNTQCFTSNESGWTAVKGSVSGNILTITAQESCSDTISWMVVGERHDQHMLDTDWTDNNGKVIVEPLKQLEE